MFLYFKEWLAASSQRCHNKVHYEVLLHPDGD